MIPRRDFLKLFAAFVLMPDSLLASQVASKGLGWSQFISSMKALAGHSENAELTAQQGLALLASLDVHANDFSQQVSNAWESGNRFWVWQRLTREKDILGGILSIEKGQDIPMHDHPGATGMVRILEGEAEVWQYDVVARTDSTGQVELKQHLHRRLKPGDTAFLLPTKGNIHTLRSITSECRMLDYFIPPYQRMERKWYVPIRQQWSDKDIVRCREIPEQEFQTS